MTRMIVFATIALSYVLTVPLGMHAQTRTQPLVFSHAQLTKGDIILQGSVVAPNDIRRACEYPAFQVVMPVRRGETRSLTLENDDLCRLVVANILDTTDPGRPPLRWAVPPRDAIPQAPAVRRRATVPPGMLQGILRTAVWHGWDSASTRPIALQEDELTVFSSIDMYGLGGTWDALTAVMGEMNAVSYLSGFSYVVESNWRNGYCWWHDSTFWANLSCDEDYWLYGPDSYSVDHSGTGWFFWPPGAVIPPYYFTFIHSLSNGEYAEVDAFDGFLSYGCYPTYSGQIVLGVQTECDAR
jgi:hypothetical protein